MSGILILCCLFSQERVMDHLHYSLVLNIFNAQFALSFFDFPIFMLLLFSLLTLVSAGFQLYSNSTIISESSS